MLLNGFARGRSRTIKLEKVYSHLQAMAQYSNKNETTTYASVAKPQEDVDCDFNPDCIREQMAGVTIPFSPCKSQQELQNAINNEHPKPWWPSENRDGNDNRHMKKFAEFLNNLIMREKTVLMEPLRQGDTKKTKEDYRMKIAETCRLIRDWSLTKGIPDDQVVYFPNEVAGEKEGVQPILYALLSSAATLEDRKSEDIHRERVYSPLHGQDTRRLVDFEAGEPRPYSKIALPFSATQVTIGAKNNARANQNAESLHQEGIKQNIGQSSKRVLLAFDIGNKGVNASSMSILLTPTHFQAVSVFLKDTGTDNINIETELSEMFPLVSREALKKSL